MKGCVGNMETQPILKQIGDLTIHDFKVYPLWVQCHIVDYKQPWYPKTNEETFRPWQEALPPDVEKYTFLVKSSYVLSDGSVYRGFITPVSSLCQDISKMLSRIQPHILHPSGAQIHFWFGSYAITKDLLNAVYRIFRKSPEQIFPIHFFTENGLLQKDISGSIPGFIFYENAGRIAVVK